MVQYGGGNSNVPILFGGLSCTGNETNLLQCGYNQPQNCFHLEDFGVSCGKLHVMMYLESVALLSFVSISPALQGR